MLPSSTKITSKSPKSCSSSDRIACLSSSCRLWCTSTTLINGNTVKRENDDGDDDDDVNDDDDDDDDDKRLVSK